MRMQINEFGSELHLNGSNIYPHKNQTLKFLIFSFSVLNQIYAFERLNVADIGFVNHREPNHLFIQNARNVQVECKRVIDVYLSIFKCCLFFNLYGSLRQ